MSGPVALDTAKGRCVSRVMLLGPGRLPPMGSFRIRMTPVTANTTIIRSRDLFPGLSGSVEGILKISVRTDTLNTFNSVRKMPIVMTGTISSFNSACGSSHCHSFTTRTSTRYLVGLLHRNSSLLPGQRRDGGVMSGRVSVGWLVGCLLGPVW